eukprot:350392-Amorphochlora_amoeboformis.AAC.1
MGFQSVDPKESSGRLCPAYVPHVSRICPATDNTCSCRRQDNSYHGHQSARVGGISLKTEIRVMTISTG